MEPDDPQVLIYEAGLRQCPGEPGFVLADLLRQAGGRYETTMPMPPTVRYDILKVVELTPDAELLAIADLTEVPVSLEHLRGLDPQTHIVMGIELSYDTDEEREWMSRGREHRTPIATILPDGTVVHGDAFPHYRPLQDGEQT